MLFNIPIKELAISNIKRLGISILQPLISALGDIAIW